MISHGFKGEVIRFNKNSNKKIQVSNFLTVIITDGIFIVGTTPLTIQFYYYMNVTENIRISILIPYIFFYSLIDQQLQIFYYDSFDISSFHVLQYDNFYDDLYMAKYLDGYRIFKLNNDSLETIKLKMGKRYFIISSTHSRNYNLIAEDSDSMVNSSIKIEILPDEFRPCLVNKYRLTRNSTESVIDINSTKGHINTGIDQLVSGWNLFAKFESSPQSLIQYEIVKVLPYRHDYKVFKLNKVFNSAWFENFFYSIDSEGDFMGEEKIINFEANPIKITKGGALKVLYQNKIIYYDFINRPIGIPLGNYCDVIFK